jgi:hypothetical protein
MVSARRIILGRGEPRMFWRLLLRFSIQTLQESAFLRNEMVRIQKATHGHSVPPAILPIASADWQPPCDNNTPTPCLP